jgi:signal transduction histidine kinase
VAVHDPSGDELGQLARRLNGMAEQVQNLLAVRQELAVIEERHRLARDLHDSVKQQIFAMAMQVAAARTLMDNNSDAARVRLTEAERLVKQAQQELTALIRELRPAALGDKGLVVALRELSFAATVCPTCANTLRQGPRRRAARVEPRLVAEHRHRR